MRLKKRRPYVLSLQTLRNYEHAFSRVARRDARRTRLRRDRAARPDPGPRASPSPRPQGCSSAASDDSTRATTATRSTQAWTRSSRQRSSKGRSRPSTARCCCFDLRICAQRPRRRAASRRLSSRSCALRTSSCGATCGCADGSTPNASSERCRTRCRAGAEVSSRPRSSPTLWQLPRARAKHARIRRSATRRAVAPPEIDREPARRLLEDERGPVGIAPGDRKYGHALIGGQGGGKTLVPGPSSRDRRRGRRRARRTARCQRPARRARARADPRATATVHYLDLGQPEIGFNPLTIGASPGATRRGVRASADRGEPARGDPGRIRQLPAPGDRRGLRRRDAADLLARLPDARLPPDSGYREHRRTPLGPAPRDGLRPPLLAPRVPRAARRPSFAAQALNPPRNKTRTAASRPARSTCCCATPTSSTSSASSHRGEVLIVNAAKGDVGEDNTRLVMQLLLQLLHRAVQAQQHQAKRPPRRVSLLLRRGPQRAHPVGRDDARRRALRRSRGRLRLAVLGPDRRRDRPLRRSLAAAVDLDLPHARDGGRPLTRRTSDGRLLRPHLESTKKTSSGCASPPTTSPASTSTTPSTSGSPGAHRAPASSPKRFPWRTLHDQQLAEHHRQAQRERGGHYPDPPARAARRQTRPRSTGQRQRATQPATDTGAAPARRRRARPAIDPDTAGAQLPLEEL